MFRLTYVVVTNILFMMIDWTRTLAHRNATLPSNPWNRSSRALLVKSQLSRRPSPTKYFACRLSCRKLCIRLYERLIVPVVGLTFTGGFPIYTTFLLDDIRRDIISERPQSVQRSWRASINWGRGFQFTKDHCFNATGTSLFFFIYGIYKSARFGWLFGDNLTKANWKIIFILGNIVFWQSGIAHEHVRAHYTGALNALALGRGVNTRRRAARVRCLCST